MRTCNPLSNNMKINQYYYNHMQEPLKIESKAYKKIIFHALRYPTHQVFGAIIQDQKSHVVDAYPLFHTGFSTPSLSLGLDLVESNIGEGQKIAGFYEFSSSESSTINRLIETNPMLKSMISLNVSTNDKSLLITCDKMKVDSPTFNEIRSDLVEGKHRIIVDMDAHLQEIELDFRNPYVQ